MESTGQIFRLSLDLPIHIGPYSFLSKLVCNATTDASLSSKPACFIRRPTKIEAQKDKEKDKHQTLHNEMKMNRKEE